MASDLDKDLLKVLYEEVSVIAKYSLDIHEDSNKQLKEVCSKINFALQDFESRLVATEEVQKTVGNYIRRIDEDVKKSGDLLSAVEKEQKASSEDRNQTKHRLQQLEEEQGQMLDNVTHLQQKQDFSENEIQKLEAQQVDTSTDVLNLKTQQNILEEKHSSLEEEVEHTKKDLTGLSEKVRSLDDKIKETGSSETSQGVFQAPNRNEFFSGRERELRMLEEAFGVSSMKSETRNKVYGISGLGGCGKTTLAAEYSWRWHAFYTGGVFWISAESQTLFRNTIMDLAFTQRTFHSDFEQCFRATLAALGRNPLPFLLVVDNADELDLPDNVRKLLSGHWMRRSSAHILCTTRRKVEELHEIANVKLGGFMTLECMAMEEAISFMYKRTNMTNAGPRGESSLPAEDLSVVTDLVDELGCLPLALEQAGSHLKVLRCTYSQYLGRFREKKLELIRQRKAKAPTEEISKERLAVHTTWLINFEYVSILAKEHAIEEFTSMVIDVSAYLSPDDIPYEVINKAYIMAGVPEGEQTEFDPTVVGSMVDILTRFSLFQSKASKSLCVHRLVQQVIQSRCSEERRGQVILSAMRMLNFAFRNTTSPADVLRENVGRPSDEGAHVQERYSLVTWARLASNAVTLKSHLAEFVTLHSQAGSKVLHTEESARLMREIAIYLSMMNQQAQAFESQKLSLEILAGGAQQESSVKVQAGLLESPVNIPLTDDQIRILRLCSKKAEQPETNCQESDTDSEHVTVDELRFKGNEAYACKDYESAILMYSEALKLSRTHACSPGDVAVLHCNRSQCYLKLEKPDDALLDADECIKRDPRSFKGFYRRALAMKMLFDEGKEEYKLAFLASAAMAIDLNPKIAHELQRHFGSAFLSTPVKVVSSQEEWEELIEETTRWSFQRKSIVFLKSGKYAILSEISESDVILFFKIHALILIGVGDVEIRNAQIGIGPGSSFHFENIVFDKANLKIFGAFLSCMGCTFQNGITTKQLKCVYNPCPGCLWCHSNNFARDGDLTVGAANLQAHRGSRIFVVQCTLRDSAGGILSSNDGSFAFVKRCKIYGHSLVSVEARDGASMVAVENEMFHSKFAQGAALGPKACSSRIANNKIYGNKSFGIMVIKESKDIVIEGNEIYQNGEHGIMITEESSVVAHRNKIFENWFWGINVSDECTARMSENVIHHNKCGGIRVAPTTAKVVLLRNEVTDHNGPGILGGEEVLGHRKLLGVEAPQTPPLKILNIEMRNEEKQQHPKERLSSLGSRCAFCHKTDGDKNPLKRCGRCFKAFYCSTQCQRRHWRKHQPLCVAIKDKFSVVVEVPPPGCVRSTEPTPQLYVRSFHPDLKGIKKSPKPDRSSTRRFIVKIQTREDAAYNPTRELTSYDQSTDVYFLIQNANIYHVIVQCGVLGKSKITGKKVFCYASFEENGKKLRIYLDELAPFQEW